MANLKESDINIIEDHMELFIESSKTDEYREGAWVVLARTRSSGHDAEIPKHGWNC